MRHVLKLVLALLTAAAMTGVFAPGASGVTARPAAGAGAGGVTWVAERMTAGASGTSLKSWLAS